MDVASTKVIDFPGFDVRFIRIAGGRPHQDCDHFVVRIHIVVKYGDLPPTRAKRRLREIFRTATLPGGLDLVLVVRRELVDAPWTTIREEFDALVARSEPMKNLFTTIARVAVENFGTIDGLVNSAWLSMSSSVIALAIGLIISYRRVRRPSPRQPRHWRIWRNRSAADALMPLILPASRSMLGQSFRGFHATPRHSI